MPTLLLSTELESRPATGRSLAVPKVPSKGAAKIAAPKLSISGSLEPGLNSLSKSCRSSRSRVEPEA